jgi:hypothetical protein
MESDIKSFACFIPVTVAGTLKVWQGERPREPSASAMPGSPRQFSRHRCKQLYFRGIVAQFEGIMTRRLLSLFAVLLATCGGLRADTTGPALIKASLMESNVAYLRVSTVAEALTPEITVAEHALTATNRIIGTVLDLRFADGDDLAAAKATASLFASKKQPLAILVNSQTRGAAATLASTLRESRDGLVFGSATADLKPDVAVTVKAADERALYQNPYEATELSVTNAIPDTNSFSPFIDHTSEADLVRAKIKDGEQDEDFQPSQPSEPQKPFIHDPVLARAVDLIKALTILHPAHS